MKRLFSILFALSLVMSQGWHSPLVNVTEVSAKEEYNIYPMACSAYEVDVLEKNGTFTQKGCYNDIGSAKNAMYALNDDGAVVRHTGAYSANKIIMMVSGIVYSYPQRNGSNTANIYQYYENIANRKTTYVTAHREMSYNGTYTYDGNGDGWIAVTLNGFDGYISLKNVDLIPMKAITQSIPMTLGGNCTLGEEDPFRVQIHQAYYSVEKNGNYLDLVYHAYSGWPSNGVEPAEWTFAIGPAASWMKEGAVYYSKNGTDFYTDRYYGNSAGTYYSYYQFLPLRTKTNISADTFESFLDQMNISADSKLRGMGNVFISAQQTYGINALSVFAMACLESAYGTSYYAMQRNNLFGWKAYDSDPNQASTFSSVEQAINEHMGINLRGFVDINDYRFFGGQLGNKGSGLNVKYASDPYWGMKIASIAYSIDKLSRNNDGTLTDFDRIALGVIANDTPTNVLQSINGSILYNTAYGSTYQKNHIVSLLSSSSGWVEIQSTNILENKSVVSLTGKGFLEYDWDTDVGWLPASAITRINSTEISQIGYEPTDDAVQLLNNATISENGVLKLSGSQYRPGIYADQSNTASNVLSIYDMSMEETVRIEVDTRVENNDRLLWQTDIDLSELANGLYTFRLETSYASTTQYNLVMSLPQLETSQSITYAGKTYTLTNLGDSLAIRIADVQCGTGSTYDAEQNACVCLDGYEQVDRGCQVITPEPADTKIMQTIQSIEYDETNAQTTIQGIAFLPSYDASSDAKITHSVIMVNMEDGKETVLETETFSPDVPLSLGDGYTYEKIGYRAVINDEEIVEGNYYFVVRVTNGNVQQDRFMITTDESLDQEDRQLDDLTVRLYSEPMSNFRLEMFVGVSGIDYTVINKPTRRPSVYGETSLSLGEEGQLSIDGYGFLTNTYIDANNHPVYQLIFENTLTGETIAQAITNKSCAVDLAMLRGTKYTIDKACFDVKVDLTSLSVGTYRIYLDVKTDQARDIFALYQYSEKDDLSVTIEKKIYTLSISSVHNQYILTIDDAE